ncbi:hypothetical protein AB1Y20_019281 [Prymnesium parvum]|uniref:6-phosphofructo-2-kinase domain-containing protein n=1 Tax=Prymnesium parvum TaxID=97485 RepID=A0AB34JUN0_PRYPA
MMRSVSDGSSSPSKRSENPYPQSWGPPTTYATRSDKIIVVMVGLPGRGKSYISRRLSHYISFFYGAPCKVFSISSYKPPSEDAGGRLLDTAKEAAAAELVDWMNEIVPERLDTGEDRYISGDFGAVAFFDSFNSTIEQREWIVKRVAVTGAKVIFLESICRDEDLVKRNVLASVTAGGPGDEASAAEIVGDFLEHIRPYEVTYEEMQEKDLSWIKIIDAGREVAMNRIRGFLPSRMAQFLINLHMTRTPFYLSRHGQSVYNELGKIGGDSMLTTHGEEYALKLGEWAATHICHTPSGKPVPARLWTSSLQRTIRTARHIPHPVITVSPEQNEWIQMRPKVFRNLDEIYAGECDGMTYEEIASAYPNEARSRKQDKFAYRYPRGESYIDLIARLEPIALEMERQREPLLIAIHRVLYAYLMGLPREQCVDVSIPLNTVIKITPTEEGCMEERFTLIQHPPGTSLDPASH